MLTSLLKNTLLSMIDYYGVFPDNPNLLSVYNERFKNVTAVQNGLKLLNEQGFIKKIRINNYSHTSNNQKDAYVITSNGKKQLDEFCEKAGYIRLQTPKMIVQRLNNRQYDMLNRMCEVKLLLGNKKDRFISREDAYSSFFKIHKKTLANSSLRFHAVYKTYDDFLPIYNIKNRVMEFNVRNERDFFQKLNDEKKMSINRFDKILVADNAEIVNKLIKDRLNEGIHFAESKINRYAFHPKRPEERTFLFLLDSKADEVNDLLFYLKFEDLISRDFYNNFYKIMKNYKPIDLFDVSNEKNAELGLPIVFFELSHMYKLYKCAQNLEKNNSKLVIVSHICNVGLLSELFKENNNVKIVYSSNENFFKVVKYKDDNAD